MKKFTFSLQAVRSLRERREKSAVEAYGEAMQKRLAILTQLASIRERMEFAYDRVRESQRAPHSSDSLSRLQDWCSTLAAEEATCLDDLEAAERNVATKWNDYLLARRELEIVQRYFNKEKENYDRELNRVEQRELDEMCHRNPAFPALLGGAVALAAN